MIYTNASSIRRFVSQCSEFDHYHIHIGNKGRSVDTLINVDRAAFEICKELGIKSQHWIIIDLEDYRSDAVYIHSVNARTAFPKVFQKGNLSRIYDDKARLVMRKFDLKGYLCQKISGFRVLVAYHKVNQFA